MLEFDIVYGTVSGNTEIVVQKVAELLISHGHQVTLHRAKTAKVENLQKATFLVLASPTYGHGQLEAYMDVFIKSVPTGFLKDKKAAIIGLGDNKYDDDFLIESAPILQEFLRDQGALEGIEPLRIAKDPWNQLETRIKTWTDKLLDLATSQT